MEIEIDPKLCFVLMPMTDKFKGIYERVIKPTVTGLGLNCVYAGEIFGARPVMNDVWEYCARACFVADAHQHDGSSKRSWLSIGSGRPDAAGTPGV